MNTDARLGAMKKQQHDCQRIWLNNRFSFHLVCRCTFCMWEIYIRKMHFVWKCYVEIVMNISQTILPFFFYWIYCKWAICLFIICKRDCSLGTLDWDYVLDIRQGQNFVTDVSRWSCTFDWLGIDVRVTVILSEWNHCA